VSDIESRQKIKGKSIKIKVSIQVKRQKFYAEHSRSKKDKSFNLSKKGKDKSKKINRKSSKIEFISF
jgi:hypothetical protein